MSTKIPVWALAVSLATASSFAIEEEFCQVAENCVDDRLSLVFASTGTSDLSKPALGDEIEVHVLLDVKSAGMFGYSYGVAHDPKVLEILSVTHKGAAAAVVGAGFKTTKIAEDKLGFVQQIAIIDPPYEPLVGEDLKLAIAKYKVLAIPGSNSKLQFSSGLKPPGSPAVATSLTVGGRARQPRTVDNAVVSGSDPVPNFSRGDANGDGAISITDAIVAVQNILLAKLVLFDCEDMLDANDDGALDTSDPVFLLNHLFRSGPPLPLPFKLCGPDGESDALPCKQPNCV